MTTAVERDTVEHIYGVLKNGTGQHQLDLLDANLFNYAGARTLFMVSLPSDLQISMRWLTDLMFKYHQKFATDWDSTRDGQLSWYSQDDNFHEARYFMYGFKRKHADDVATAAVAQAVRMLQAERAHPRYLAETVGSAAPPPDFSVAYAVHDDMYAQRMRDVQQDLEEIGADRNPIWTAIDRKNQQVRTRRAQLLRDRWLPALIPAEEAATLATVPYALIEDMYGQLLPQGYMSYISHKRARG